MKHISCDNKTKFRLFVRYINYISNEFGLMKNKYSYGCFKISNYKKWLKVESIKYKYKYNYEINFKMNINDIITVKELKKYYKNKDIYFLEECLEKYNFNKKEFNVIKNTLEEKIEQKKQEIENVLKEPIKKNVIKI